MKKKERIIKIFHTVSSDLNDEKDIASEIVKKINKDRAKSLHSKFEITFSSIDEELPAGDQNTQINKMIQECDIFIFGLWKKWNLYAWKILSPFEEEFEIARNKFQVQGKPLVICYFKEIPDDMICDPGEQLKKVLEFRTNIESSKKVLYYNYEKVTQFSSMLYEFLWEYLDNKSYDDILNEENAKRLIDIPDEIIQKINLFHKKYMETEFTGKGELSKTSMEFAMDAFRCIKEYKFTLAQECFIKSLEMEENPYVLDAYGLMLIQLDYFFKAEEKFNRLLQISNSYEDGMLLKSYAYNNLGNMYEVLEDLDNASKMYKKALDIDLQLKRKEGIISNYNNLGIIYRKQNEFDKAEAMYKKALDADLHTESTQATASAYGNLGNIYLLKDELDKAETMYKKALDIDMNLWCKEEIVTDCFNLGNVYTKRGDFLNAEEMYDKSLELSSENWIKKEIASNYCYLARRYGTDGNLDRSESLYNKALGLSRELGSKKGMASIYLNLGILYEHKGDFGKTKEFWIKSEEYYNQMGNEKEVNKLRTWIRDLDINE